MSRSIALALALLLTVPALAEDHEVEKPADARIVGVRYSLLMRTGREIGGIVRVRGVFERRVRGVWEECDPEDKGAGVRLWYPKKQDGYTFHPIIQIKKLDELGAVTADESASIHRARHAAQRRADGERAELKRKREEAARRRAEAEAAEKGEDKPAAEEKPAEDKPADKPSASDEEKKRDERFEELLLQYPPTDWKPDRPKKIERRRVVLGLFPSDEEKAFLEVYDEWNAAYEWWAAKIADSSKTDGEEPTDGEADGEGSEDSEAGAADESAETADSR